MSRRLVLGSLRELGTVGLVAALCGCYAAVLVTVSDTLATVGRQQGGGGFAAMLVAVATVFVLIALYVSAVVIVNCVDTVITGRLRQIALLRLLGARARSLRASVVRGTGLVGLGGAVAGTVVGTSTADVVRAVLVARGTLPRFDYPVASGWLLAPVLLISLTALAAGRVGSRTVLRGSPVRAMSGAVIPPAPARRTSTVRAVLVLLLLAGGAAVLALAMWLGEHGSAAGFLFAFLGAAASGTGLLVGARSVIPRVVSSASRVLGSGPATRVARRNAVNDPLRTTRSTMGLVIGVTLVTTFASSMRALQVSVGSWTDLSAAQRQQAEAVLSMATSVLIAVVVISSVISAVGFVSTMSLTVIQRQREIGLLRALGFTRQQVRRMITKESAALSGTAVVLGMALGVLYGSVGAQSLIGVLTDGFAWGLPWPVLAAIGAAGVALVLVAARQPARRAVRVTPIEALRVTT
jgi:putative ABC transport system permease protein